MLNLCFILKWEILLTFKSCETLSSVAFKKVKASLLNLLVLVEEFKCNVKQLYTACMSWNWCCIFCHYVFSRCLCWNSLCDVYIWFIIFLCVWKIKYQYFYAFSSKGVGSIMYFWGNLVFLYVRIDSSIFVFQPPPLFFSCWLNPMYLYAIGCYELNRAVCQRS